MKESFILKEDDPMCDDVNCRIFWGIVRNDEDLEFKYLKTLENHFSDRDDIDYKLIVESLIQYINTKKS